MGNIAVLTSDNCHSVVGFGQVPLAPHLDPDEAIVVRHKPGIINGNSINKFNEAGKIIYQLEDLTLTKPAVAFSNDAGTREVGETVASVLFSGNITQGTYPITSKQITPDPGGLDLEAPFSFEKTNVTRSTPGAEESHTVQAQDSNGGITSKTSSVPFKLALYQGFNSLAVLDEDAIKALVNKHLIDSILQQYSGAKTYTVPGSPGGPKYIYWVGPVGSPLPSAASLSGLAFPLYTGHANVDVENIHGVVQAYWVVRSANRLDIASYVITLS